MVLCLLSRDSHGDTTELNHEETVRGPIFYFIFLFYSRETSYQASRPVWHGAACLSLRYRFSRLQPSLRPCSL